ncbi:hypothetical protein VCHA43P277_30032 [Vibrio chagasii]|uniref:hypothetical protein n=1 Tax=Vibrio sp. T3Y01 TaxID=2607606 RepID=UPI0020A5E43B|nr:hypothetical protein [Vibrio sp. T3Y01]CAH6811999.1 hypothetical protein VCHA35P150_120063 [Vibrio chagasii]CAK2519696.1 hypothetical protein VCRA2111O136_50206 [Vibrio crassostreae]CAH6837834.1 hypothetical protein VCHA35O141_10044 [Vibrio chagasii]CAH6846390.1 hypothetical protein VCHA32O87_10066 [Vibrio chagasii]CAH6879241.1 hypothetical protein VCHA31O73_20044 [Vibrio chagasii]
MPTAPALPTSIVPQDLSLNDLIFELAKAKNVTAQTVHVHYNSVFNTNAWSQERGFEHALAKRVLKQDLENELRSQTPELQLLKQQARDSGLALVDRSEYQSFQGRMQMQQKQIEKLIDDVMALSRNHNSLLNRVM